MINLIKKISLSIVILFSITSLASAETTISAEGQYIFNTLGFYLGGVLVAFMAAGFCMLECGLVTTKSVSTIAAKNIGKFAIASIVFFLCGYNLAYGIPEGGYIGSFKIWSDASEIGTGYSDYSDWFYQAMFVCATVSIVSGAVAERIKIWPFFIFSAVMAAFIYPISMGWQWGGGWLATAGFSDFAGSTLVHACGGAAALAGVMVLGARAGRFGKKGETTSLQEMPNFLRSASLPSSGSSFSAVSMASSSGLLSADLLLSATPSGSATTSGSTSQLHTRSSATGLWSTRASMPLGCPWG